MDMFNGDDVATLMAKRKQKFAGSFARMDSMCKLVTVESNQLLLLLMLFFSCVVAVVIIVLLFVFFLCMAVLMTK